MESIKKAARKIEEEGGMVIPIKMSGPFHSPLMKKAAERFKVYLSKYDYKDIQHFVIANHKAYPYKGKDSIINNLTN